MIQTALLLRPHAYLNSEVLDILMVLKYTLVVLKYAYVAQCRCGLGWGGT